MSAAAPVAPPGDPVNREFLRTHRTPLLALALSAALLCAYGQLFRNQFVSYDDLKYVVENPLVKSGLTLEGVRWAFTSMHDANWFPLTLLSHMLDVELFGTSPAGHHGVNLLLHVLTTLLLFLFLQRTTGASGRSAVAAALFALHPLRVESVAWAAERKDVLSALFGLLTILAYLRYVRQPGLGRYLAVALLLALGLMAKPMLVTLPLALVLLDAWPLYRLTLLEPPPDSPLAGVPRITLVRSLLEKLPLLLLSVASSVVTVIVQHQGGSLDPAAVATFGYNLASALVGYAAYLGKLFWPAGLAVFYPLPQGFSTGEVVGSLLLLAVLSLICLWRWRQTPWLAVGWLWFLGTLVPVSGLVRVGAQFIADRYTYLPSIGIAVIVAWGGWSLLGRLRYRTEIAAPLTGAVLLLLGVLTWIQVGYWQNTITLFERALAVTQRNWLAHNNLAAALIKAGRLPEAHRHLTAALRYRPDYASAVTNLGVIAGKVGNTPQAIAYYRQAIEMNPQEVDAHFNLGLSYLGSGAHDLAMAEYRALLPIAPAQAERLLMFISYARQMP